MHTDAFVRQLVSGYDTWPRFAAGGDSQASSDAASSSKDGSPSFGAAAMTQDLYPYTELFSPIQINKTIIKNRIVMAPMGNIDMAEETGRPSTQMLEYFFARAKGGAGLITTGLVPVSFGIDNSIIELGDLSYFPRIDRSRTVLVGWRNLAQGVHAFGAKIFVQLTPGLGRVGNPQCLLTQTKLPVSASFNPNFYISSIPCWRLSDRKLKKIIKNAGQAAADSHAMGLDGVYLHGHEGYLLEQVTNPAFNRRKLGRYADWQRFGVDMVREMRRRVGPHYPIMYRIDLSLALNETYGRRMEGGTLKKFTNGRSVDMTLDYMKALVAAGVDIFDVDLGCYDNWWLPHPPSSMPAGCFLPVARLVKEHFEKEGIKSNAGVPVPVVGVGKLGYPDLAEAALRNGDCDMVMLGRPLLADADWPNKAYAGEVEAIRPCIGCQEGCLNEFVEGGHPQCAVNPRSGFEYMLPEIPPDAPVKKKIAVVGGGPAGVIFALTAAQRGHKVELFEKTASVGGRIIPGSVPAIKFDIRNYLTWMQNELKTAEKAGKLKVHFNAEADADTLKKGKFDAAVVAIGTKVSALPVPGADEAKTVQAIDLLNDPALLGGAKNVVVVGGGSVGCEVAEWLCYEKGAAVTVVEILPYFMDGVCTANRGHLLHALHDGGAKLLNCAKVSSLAGGKVTVQKNNHKNVPDPYNSWSPILPENIENPLAPKLGEELTDVTLDADLVVLAIGGKADDALYFDIQKANAAAEVYPMGDSFSPGRVLEAVRAAYRLGTTI